MWRLCCALVILVAAPKTVIGEALIACDVFGVSVTAATRGEAERTCEYVKRADRRLRQLGLSHYGDLLVEVTDELSDEMGSCVAAYDARSHRLSILSETCLAASYARTDAFPEMPPHVQFESLIHHELTHAYVAEALDGRFLPRAALEYLAYAVQVDFLPRAVRTELLSTADITEPVVIGELNDSILYFAPGRFAAAAWLYFQQNGGDRDAVDDVLTGKVRFPRSR